MKKQKLQAGGEQYHDYSIFSISATLADYQLAFQLNKTFEIKLEKQTDLPVYLSGSKPQFFSLFYYKNDLMSEFQLIQDLGSGDQLMNSFLFILKGHFPEAELTKFNRNIAELNDIFSVNMVNPGQGQGNKNKVAKTIQFINTILTDLEYHLLEISRLKDEKKVKLKPASHKTIRKLYNG